MHFSLPSLQFFVVQFFRSEFEVYDLDKIVNSWNVRSAMIKAATEVLEAGGEEVVSELRKLLKEQSGKFSPSRLAELAEIAFETTFAGLKREDKLANAIARGISVREKMGAEEGGSMSADETARHVGFTKQSALNMYHAGKLLGWRSEKQGAIRFPVWQFADRRRLPGLPAVLTKLNEGNILDDWGKIGFFLQTHTILKARRPLDLLREGVVDPVLKAAEAYVQ